MSAKKQIQILRNGDLVREKVTGFKGIITGTCFYLTGCTQFLVTAKSKDDTSEATAIWYDEGRLELVKKQVISSDDVRKENDGCDIAPTIGKRGG